MLSGDNQIVLAVIWVYSTGMLHVCIILGRAKLEAEILQIDSPKLFWKHAVHAMGRNQYVRYPHPCLLSKYCAFLISRNVSQRHASGK